MNREFYNVLLALKLFLALQNRRNKRITSSRQPIRKNFLNAFWRILLLFYNLIISNKIHSKQYKINKTRILLFLKALVNKKKQISQLKIEIEKNFYGCERNAFYWFVFSY